METFCTLINFPLALFMFPNDVQSFAASERIVPLQVRLKGVAQAVRDY